MYWLNFATKLIGVLHSGKDPRHLAKGFALGALLGLTPLFALHNLLLVLLILVLNVSISAAFFGFLLFSGFAYIFDPQFHSLGYFLLVQLEPLRPFWTWLYNVPIAPLTRFYNTVVLGSLVAGLALVTPIYYGFLKGIRLYQDHLGDRINRLPLVKLIRGSTVFQWYNRIKLQ